MIKSISISELMKLSNINIIDIRSIEKYNNNHINGSINIQAKEIIKNPSKYLNKDNKYYIYCQRGIQSRKLCVLLHNIGYDVINIEGGYEAWILSK